MNCLENLVGVRCAGTTSTSGLYIEDLEGMNLKNAANIADSRYVSGLELLQKKIKFAEKGLLQDIEGAFLPYFRINSFLDEIKIGHFKSNYLTTSANQRGVKIKTRSSRLLKIRIQKIELDFQETLQSGQIKILDGNEITLFDFTTDSSGKAVLLPEYLSKTNEVFVVLEDNTFTPRDGQIKNGCHCYSKSTEFLIGWGWNNNSQTTSSFGISVDALAECNNEEIICLISSRLGFPLLYKSGIEIVKEWISSDRLNPVTMIDDGTEEFLLEEFSRQYKRSLKILIETLPSLMARIDEVCVVCSQSRYIETTP
jgi:hypothetical protein